MGKWNGIIGKYSNYQGVPIIKSYKMIKYITESLIQTHVPIICSICMHVGLAVNYVTLSPYRKNVDDKTYPAMDLPVDRKFDLFMLHQNCMSVWPDYLSSLFYAFSLYKSSFSTVTSL